MATFLYNALSLAALLQAPRSGRSLPGDSTALLWARVARDSGDGRGWFMLGRVYLDLSEHAHAPPHLAAQDTVWVRALLDTADRALGRAAALLGAAGANPEADSARVLRVGAWSARSRLAWEERGPAAGPQEWGPVPADLKLPPVLEELGENLLRACPTWGVLFTAQAADSYAAWYMRFSRGLRPDLLVVPLAAARSDPVLQARLAQDLKLGRRSERAAWLPEIVKHRPVCVSMGFDRPPEVGSRIRWSARPLVWTTGPEGTHDHVPPHDFVFAALRMALDVREVWAEPALTLYGRAARATPALCGALATFRLTSEIPSCRR